MIRFLVPLNINKKVQVDESLLSSPNRDFELFLEILQVEIDLFNNLEQQRSILAQRLKVLGGNPESSLKLVFNIISSQSETSSDQRFISFDLFNFKLREEGRVSALDMEEYLIFNTCCNNYYDSDSEISENEFILFLVSFRKQSEVLYRIIANKLAKIDRKEEADDLTDLVEECTFESGGKIMSFLDEGVEGSIPYRPIHEQQEELQSYGQKGNHIMTIIRGSTAKESSNFQQDYDRYNPRMKDSNFAKQQSNLSRSFHAPGNDSKVVQGREINNQVTVQAIQFSSKSYINFRTRTSIIQEKTKSRLPGDKQ